MAAGAQHAPQSCSNLSRDCCSRVQVLALGERLPTSIISRAIPSTSSGCARELHMHLKGRGASVMWLVDCCSCLEWLLGSGWLTGGEGCVSLGWAIE